MGKIKETLKDWLVEHERLYWYIVVGIAVFAFGFITMLGLAKLEKANAATYDGYTVDDVTLPDIRDMVWEPGTVEYMEDLFGVGVDIADKIIKEHSYMIITVNQFQKPNYKGAEILFTDYPVQYTNEAGLITSSKEYLYSDVERSVLLSANYTNNTISLLYGYGKMWDYNGTQAVIPMRCCSTNASTKVFGSTYDYYESDSNTSAFPRNNLIYPVVVPPTQYSPDAPYTSFESVFVDNKMAQGQTIFGTLFSDMYSEFTATSKWRYHGMLKNRDVSADLEYWLDAKFVVELPTFSYILELYEKAGVDVSWEHNVLKYCPDAVRIWNTDDKAEKRSYEFRYVGMITPDENGRFSYELTFVDILNYIKYNNPDLISEFNAYDENSLSLLLSFLHVDYIMSNVRTTRSDCVLYGNLTTNDFDRGIYDVCLEVIPEVDYNTATPEEIDKIVQDAFEEAHDKYLSDLEQSLEDLQNQYNGMTSVDGAFADLQGSDLWSGFGSLAKGLSSLAPAIASVAVIIGTVLSFIPGPVMSIITFTLLAICIISIIKAIRG